MEPTHHTRWLRWQRRLLRPLALALPRGGNLLGTTNPLPTLRHRSPRERAKMLLVLLPGIDELPGDFQTHGFAESVWRAGVPADLLELDLHLGYYLRQCAVERLHEDVIRLARAQGYERIWLVGLSLGGLGALLYARRHADAIDGVVLLAPYLGCGGGPLQNLRTRALQGEAGARSEEFSPRALWAWLMERGSRPPLYLGFGETDRFAPSHRLMAELLPKGHVFAVRGGHDWNTWGHLWSTILSRVLTQPRRWA